MFLINLAYIIGKKIIKFIKKILKKEYKNNIRNYKINNKLSIIKKYKYNYYLY